MPITFKGIGDTKADCICSLRERVQYSRITGLGAIKRKTKKMATSDCYFQNGIVLVRRSRSGIGDGVGVDISRLESESELESLEIRRLRSPAPSYA